MEVKHLQAFVAVVQEGSFRGASKLLGISQPALSIQIGKLEDSLSCMLFDRHPSGITLTDCGKLLHDRAQVILGMLDETRDLVSAQSSAGPISVRVSAIPTIAPIVLPKSVQLFKERYDDAAVSLSERTTESLCDGIARGEIDIGVTSKISPGSQDTYIAEHIGDEPLMLAIAESSKWASRDKLCTDDLQEAGIIVLDEMHCLSEQVTEICATQGIDHVVQIDSGQLSTLIELVRNAVGISLLPSSILSNYITDGILVREVYGNPITRPLYTIINRHLAHSDAVNEMSRCIKSTIVQSNTIISVQGA
ncbi:MAG: LysR family transcriptional regulator [Phycisphaera sp.]|nr:MAG: LysR family transcriptional regulator [Phycisphaera sp.]